MKLVMFDIDGTLKEADRIFDDLFVQALTEYLGVSNVDIDWGRYRHATDSAVTIQIIEEQKGRSASKEDLNCILKILISKVQRLASNEPHHFREVPGARAMLTELASFPGVAIAIATGNWKEIALLKLEMISLILPNIVVSTASDALAREEIMKIAEKKTMELKNVSFSPIVYVGDAVWDVRGASNNGYEFIGVGNGEKASRLKEQGAKWVIANYIDRQRFFNILEEIWNTK